jgi:hypothetical protein
MAIVNDFVLLMKQRWGSPGGVWHIRYVCFCSIAHEIMSEGGINTVFIVCSNNSLCCCNFANGQGSFTIKDSSFKALRYCPKNSVQKVKPDLHTIYPHLLIWGSIGLMIWSDIIRASVLDQEE